MTRWQGALIGLVVGVLGGSLCHSLFAAVAVAAVLAVLATAAVAAAAALLSRVGA